MKFLCVECDEPMKLERTAGPDRGSMSVFFACPSCGRKVAMLTNAMETQMVRSLGVRIGTQTGEAVAPMETIRQSLSDLATPDDAAGSTIETTPQSSKPTGETHVDESGGKCPFTGMVNEAFQQESSVRGEPTWTAEALQRLDRIPVYVRGMVEKGVVEYAKEKGVTEIDGAVMDEARGRFGM